MECQHHFAGVIYEVFIVRPVIAERSARQCEVLDNEGFVIGSHAGPDRNFRVCAEVNTGNSHQVASDVKAESLVGYYAVMQVQHFLALSQLLKGIVYVAAKYRKQ